MDSTTDRITILDDRSTRPTGRSDDLSRLISKVPEVTVYFWVIKVLCTTVGESAADFLNVNLNAGLTGTSIVTGVLLAVALAFQFRASRYRPGLYWLTVALVSVFGTLVTDNLTDRLNVRLEVSTIVFSVLLSLTFLVWYAYEKTLDIHHIFTVRREAFYWLAVLFSFALGTATGDLMAESLGIGYFSTGIIVMSVIAVAAVARRLGLNSVLAFWIIYIMTRPLGASIGDYLSQPSRYGGLGLGATVTSALFIAGIIGTVAFLSVTHADVTTAAATDPDVEQIEKGGLLQTAVVVTLLLAVGITGYYWRTSALANDTSTGDTISVSVDAPTGAATPPGATSPGGSAAPRDPSAVTQRPPTSRLGNLSTFRTITQDTLNKLNSNDQSGATSRIDDLEHEWDIAQARLKPKDGAKWTQIDDKIDTVLRELRAVSPKMDSEKAALTALLGTLA